MNATERDQELEQEATSMLEDKSIPELLELKKEIETTLAADRSMSLELAYWSNVLKKIDQKVSEMRIQQIYTEFCSSNREKLELKVAEARRKAKVEQSEAYQNPFTALKIDNIKQQYGEDSN